MRAREILEVKVEDESGATMLVFWDKKSLLIEVKDVPQIWKGLVTSFKRELRISVEKTVKQRRLSSEKD